MRALLALLVLALAAPARAEDDAACVLAFERAQALRHAGALRQSRDQLRFCAQPSCPERLIDRCRPWLEEVRDAIPTIIVAAKDPSGRDLTEARVRVDGELVAESLDGRPIEMDPGPRRITVERDGHRPASQDLRIVEGDKGRRLEVVLEPRAAPLVVLAEPELQEVPEAAAQGISGAGIASYTFLALGASSLVAGAITGSMAIQRAVDLRYFCGGNVCTPEYQPAYEEGLVLAHVSTGCFALSGAAFVAALVAWALDEPAELVPIVTRREIGLLGRF